MANISLNKSVRTCKVNTGWADRMYSDRFQNSEAIICPVWNGVDTAGRPSCKDAFYTKYQGCTSANDRIDVENLLRPQYMEYVTLDAIGISGAAEDCDCNIGVGTTESFEYVKPMYKGVRENYNYDAAQGCQTLENIPRYTGQFGQGNFRSFIEPTCNPFSYENADAQCAADKRTMKGAMLGAEYFRKRKCS